MSGMPMSIPFTHMSSGLHQRRAQSKVLDHFEGDAIMTGFVMLRNIDHESELSEIEIDYDGYWRAGL
jgi:hypothetical protein